MSKYAPAEYVDSKDVEERQFCTFYVGDRLYGVDILTVNEINTESAFTRVYHAPDTIRGCVNIRGQIYLVLDLPRLLGTPSTGEADAQRLVLFNETVGSSFGSLVDRIGDVVTVSTDRIEERRESGASNRETAERRNEISRLTEGVCKMEDDLMVILDPKALLEHVEEYMGVHG
jgi:chemotaxis signal transduction protein